MKCFWWIFKPLEEDSRERMVEDYMGPVNDGTDPTLKMILLYQTLFLWYTRFRMHFRHQWKMSHPWSRSRPMMPHLLPAYQGIISKATYQNCFINCYQHSSNIGGGRNAWTSKTQNRWPATQVTGALSIPSTSTITNTLHWSDQYTHGVTSTTYIPFSENSATFIGWLCSTCSVRATTINFKWWYE